MGIWGKREYGEMGMGKLTLYKKSRYNISNEESEINEISPDLVRITETNRKRCYRWESKQKKKRKVTGAKHVTI